GGRLSCGLLSDGRYDAGPSTANITTQAGGLLEIRGITATRLTYSGAITGGGAVTVSGPTDSVQVFATATHTYTGGTTITSGNLAVLGSIPGPVTVSNTGTLLGTGGVAGLGRVAGTLQVNAGGTLSMGDGSPTNPTGILNVTGTVTLAPGAVFRLVM